VPSRRKCSAIVSNAPDLVNPASSPWEYLSEDSFPASIPLPQAPSRFARLWRGGPGADEALTIVARITKYPAEGHATWDFPSKDPHVFEWMFDQAIDPASKGVSSRAPRIVHRISLTY
jgi:hypothetical protein